MTVGIETQIERHHVRVNFQYSFNTLAACTGASQKLTSLLSSLLSLLSSSDVLLLGARWLRLACLLNVSR